jgi:hypothetical protein
MIPDNSSLFARLTAKAEKAERFLLAGLDDEGRALLASTNAADDANLVALRVYRTSDRGAEAKAAALAAHRAAYASRDAWSFYLIRTQATRVRRALALGLSKA